MDKLITVYESRPMPPAKAAWLQNLLEPIRIACKLPPIPLELRPMAWSGLCVFDEVDSRVALSNRAVFWDKRRIAQVYLHEVAHRLQDELGLEVAHGVEFFTLLLCLQMRSNALQFNLGGYKFPINNMTFYDCQDLSPLWQAYGLEAKNGISIQFEWARVKALELAMSDLDAVSVAKAIPSLWVKHVEKLSHAKSQKDSEKQEVAKRIKGLESESSFFKAAFFVTLFFAWIGFGFMLMMNF